MIDANDNPTGGLHGIRAADSGDPAAPTKETEAQEEIFVCPHCRRAFSADQVNAEIANQKAARDEEAQGQEREIGQGIPSG